MSGLWVNLNQLTPLKINLFIIAGSVIRPSASRVLVHCSILRGGSRVIWGLGFNKTFSGSTTIVNSDSTGCSLLSSSPACRLRVSNSATSASGGLCSGVRYTVEKKKQSKISYFLNEIFVIISFITWKRKITNIEYPSAWRKFASSFRRAGFVSYAWSSKYSARLVRWYRTKAQDHETISEVSIPLFRLQRRKCVLIYANYFTEKN